MKGTEERKSEPWKETGKSRLTSVVTRTFPAVTSLNRAACWSLQVVVPASQAYQNLRKGASDLGGTPAPRQWAFFRRAAWPAPLLAERTIL